MLLQSSIRIQSLGDKCVPRIRWKRMRSSLPLVTSSLPEIIKYRRHGRTVDGNFVGLRGALLWNLRTAFARATNKIVILPVHFLHYDFAVRFTTEETVNMRLPRLCIPVYIHILMRTYAYKMIRFMRMAVDVPHPASRLSANGEAWRRGNPWENFI